MRDISAKIAEKFRLVGEHRVADVTHAQCQAIAALVEAAAGNHEWHSDGKIETMPGNPFATIGPASWHTESECSVCLSLTALAESLGINPEPKNGGPHV